MLYAVAWATDSTITDTTHKHISLVGSEQGCRETCLFHHVATTYCTESSKKMDGIWNRYNLKSTGRIYMFGILKCSEKFKVLDLP